MELDHDCHDGMCTYRILCTAEIHVQRRREPDIQRKRAREKYRKRDREIE